VDNSPLGFETVDKHPDSSRLFSPSQADSGQPGTLTLAAPQASFFSLSSAPEGPGQTRKSPVARRTSLNPRDFSETKKTEASRHPVFFVANL
jgi:hypothetical protein